MEKNQKIKASQPGAKSSINGWLQFEDVGMVAGYLSVCNTSQIAFWCG
jgi:hypothetical protein